MYVHKSFGFQIRRISETLKFMSLASFKCFTFYFHLKKHNEFTIQVTLIEKFKSNILIYYIFLLKKIRKKEK